MCTFCSDLPSSERASGKKAFITLFLKPNDPNNPKEAYRFRLLNFRSPAKNDRTYPFISRYVHNHWGVNESGMRVVDDVAVCPSSSFIDARNDVDLGFVDTFKELKLREEKPTWNSICPVCRQVAQAWNAYNNSGKTDRLALERATSMKKQFQGVVPVYVINDPINPKNNGRFKCFIINDKDEYERFIGVVNTERARIKAEGNSYDWCNGENAVDFYLRMEKVPVVYKNGQEGTKRSITVMRFGRQAYDLVDTSGKAIITKEAIDKFEFDDQYYVKNTKTELEEFFKKYYSLASSNVPDEDIDMLTSDPAPVKTAPKQELRNTAQPQKKVDVDALDDLASDPDDLPFDPPAKDDGSKAEPDAPQKSVEELLKELDFSDDE